MSRRKPNSESDDIYDDYFEADMTGQVYTNTTPQVYRNTSYEHQESNGINIERIQIETEVTENEYDTIAQGVDSNNSRNSIKASPSAAAVGNQDVATQKKTNRKAKPYIRMDYITHADEIPKLFSEWKLVEPDVLFSVVSDSQSPTVRVNEVIEAMVDGSAQNICRSLVTAASSTNAWIITGGLNKGIDNLIGSEVKQRLTNRDNIPLGVLGISDWEYLSEKKDLLKDSIGSISNPSELSLNSFHTHFLLVDNDRPTEADSSSDCRLRQLIELALRKWETDAAEKVPSRPLIYVLIGGSVNAFGVVKHALANRIPVVVATGTGGAADIICGTLPSKDGAALDFLPEIVDKLFHRLEELLLADETPENKVRDAIANIKSQTKLDPFFEILELLDKAKLSEEAEEQFRNSITTLRNKATIELLAGIKFLISSKRTPVVSRTAPVVADSEPNAVDRMRSVFEQMLVVNGIPKEKATKAVSDVESNLLDETLTKAKLVNSNMKAIRTQNQSELLIKFDIDAKQRQSITSVIIEVLKKQKSTKPSDVFLLAVDWDDEKFFRQLLLEKWMWHEHENVFMKLLEKDETKYVKLIMENNCKSKWLIRPQESLKKEFSKIKFCEDLLKKIKDPESKAGNRIMGKVLFVWCIWKQMHETAMLFWKQGQDCLAMTLIGYQESRKQRRALSNKEGYEHAKKQTKVFAKQTLHFVGKCYENSHKYTHDLLIGKVRDLGNRTPLQIAVDADFKAFVSETPIQTLLNKIWMKDIENHTSYKYAPMLLSEACPLLAPVLLDIPDDRNKEKEKHMPDGRHKAARKYFSKIGTFLDIPLVKFSYAFISLLVYLTLFSIVLLTDFVPTMGAAEIVLTIWTFILITEEVIQAIVDIREYKGNKWNYLDGTALTLYIIGFILRIIYQCDSTICPDCLYVARIVLAFSLLIFFFRTLQFLSVYESLGPKIFMIYQLVSDLAGFLVILAVFISAYGVVSNVILYPNQPLNGNLLQDVFYDAWWSVIQNFNREDASGANCDGGNQTTLEYCMSTSNVDIDYEWCKEQKCPANNWIVPILLAVYSLITCVMLLNVLIAIFNSTFTAINDEQKEVSRMQRYLLIREFSTRSMVPPPFSVFTYPYFIFKELRRRHKAGLLRCPSKGLDRSRTDLRNEEPSIIDENEDFEGDEKVKKSGKATDQETAFEKNLISAVKTWEHHVVADYYKENEERKGWYVARLESETEKSDEFIEAPFMQIRYPD